MSKNVLITGGTGLVGKELTKLLVDKSYKVAVLSRKKNINSMMSFYWDYENDILDDNAIKFADIIVHLAGENISKKKWTKKQKKIIIDSRVKTTNLIYNKIKKSNKKLIKIISASAIGYYGTYNSDKIFTEEDKAGEDFLADVVHTWEKSVDQFKDLEISTTKLRIGVVLSKEGGALPQIIAPIKLGIGSAIGDGTQYMPWIEISDLTNLVLYLIENDNLEKVYNAVCPNHITNKELVKNIAYILKKPFFFPNVPEFVVKLIYGEMSSILLKGSRVSSEKIQKSGFEFKYQTIKDIFR